MSSFRMPAVVELAWVAQEAGPPPVSQSIATPIADRARGSIARVGRANYEVRDALSAMADVMGGLERELQRLQGMMTLREQGVDLRRDLAEIGPDGVRIQRSLGVAMGSRGWLVLCIEVRDAQQLLVIPAIAEGFEVSFVEPSREIRDLLVAFTFQQEARELRRQRVG